MAVGLLNTGNFGNVGPTFGDFNISFTAAAVGLHCPTSDANAQVGEDDGWHGPINRQYQFYACQVLA